MCIRDSTSDNAEQQARFPRLRLLITDKLSFMESGRDLMKSEGFAASQRLILPGRGKLLMEMCIRDSRHALSPTHPPATHCHE